MQANRDPKYLHPLLRAATAPLLAAINARLPPGQSARVISMYRSPAEQFELFKQGRAANDGGKWVVVDKAKIVTGKDGYINLSRHNTLPCTSMDIGLFGTDSSGREIYFENSVHYKKIGPAAASNALDWGGNWTTLVDEPHVEIPLSRFFLGSLKKDVALQWQRYLRFAGAYTGALDGIFGEKSKTALQTVTGTHEPDTNAWNALFTRFGPVELLAVP